MDDAGTLVEWREWGREAFAEAEAADEPVFLVLSAPWCVWCRRMDERTFAEPRIAAHLDDGFVPVRVDADRRPRVRERYGMGGFPSVVFLTPAGDILTGATYLGPDGMRQVIERVRETWAESGREAGRVPRALRDPDPPAGDVTGEIEAHMESQVAAAFDGEFGGWGSGAKFPLPRTVEFACKRDRDRATRTLEALRTHLYDTYDGGFYRYAGERDWGDPRREKLLDANAGLVRAFATGYLHTGDEPYREVAEGTVDYLTTTLWTGEAFAGSQAGGEYFTLEPAEREAAEPPAVDDTAFADRNGLAADALLRSYAYTGHEPARRYAERALAFVREELIAETGAVAHYAAPDDGLDGDADADADSSDGDADDDAGASGDDVSPPRGLLVDQARVLAGLVALAQATGDGVADARRVADWTLDHLRAPGGAFVDGPREGPGLLDRPLCPLDSTAELADALVDLSYLADEPRYREAAGGALAAFAGATERMGVEVAGYATACARYLDPLVIETPPAGSDLHRAALRADDHERVVVPGGRDRAVVIRGDERIPVETPGELANRVRGGDPNRDGEGVPR